MSGGISSAAQMVESYGRGPDTMLAHISPDEAKVIDYLQGGRKTNPNTGLAEYGMFGKIIKGLVRAGAAIAGGMLGGPAGAAAASAAATKLTGGSWKQAAVGGALGGIGAGLGNMAAGTGFMGTTGLAGAASNSVPLSQLGQVASQTVLPTGIAGSIAGATSAIGGLGGVGAGLGGFMAEPRDTGGGINNMPTQPPLDPNISYNPQQPVTREYSPYEGDYATYGQRGEHAFYKPKLNVEGLALARGGQVRRYADGGEVNMWGAAPDETFIAKLLAQRGRPLEEQLAEPATMDDPAMGFVGSMSGPKIPMAEKMSRQGGAMKSSPGLKKIADALDSHQVEWEYDDMGGIRAFMEAHHPSKGWFKQPKTFKENTSLKTLRDWLGYAKGGRVQSRPASRAIARSGISSAASIGRIKGPGTTTSDDIPAMLSDNEHVLDAEYVKLKGKGSFERGHKAIEKEKRKVRRAAGIPAPYRPAAARAESAAKVGAR